MPTPLTKLVQNFHGINTTDLAYAGFVITQHPSDFPEHFVVRLYDMARNLPTVYAALAKDLNEARRLIPLGLTRINRFRMDDPVIVETWI